MGTKIGPLEIEDSDSIKTSFPNFKDELNRLPEPFFTSLFTLSSHSQFDFPGEHKLSFDYKYDSYLNSIAYTDKYLGEFFDSVKHEDWYSNTLFVPLLHAMNR